MGETSCEGRRGIVRGVGFEEVKEEEEGLVRHGFEPALSYPKGLGARTIDAPQGHPGAWLDGVVVELKALGKARLSPQHPGRNRRSGGIARVAQEGGQEWGLF